MAKVTDFNRDFGVTSARFCKIIERVFVVNGLIFNFIKKLTEKNENKFQTFNLENCAYFGVSSMGNDPHIKFKRSFSPKARNNLTIIDRIIEGTRFLFAFIDFSPKFEQKKFQTFTFFLPRFKLRACSGDSRDSGHCLSKIMVTKKKQCEGTYWRNAVICK